MQALDLPNIPVVCLNGCAGFLFKTPPTHAELEAGAHTPIFSASLSASLILDTDKVISEQRAALPFRSPIQFYTADGTIYCTASSSSADEMQIMKDYEVLTGTKQVQVTLEEVIAIHEKTPMMKMLVLCGGERVEACHAWLKEGLAEQHDCTLIKGSPSWFVEVLPTGANKGEGLKRMCTTLAMDISSVVAFGDGNNDVEFLKYAGFGVAMANASEACQRAANCVIEHTNDEHGVHKTLEEYFADRLLVGKEEGIKRQVASVSRNLKA
jgi:hydroxymethylpyrimidine pyrophosphatase-like HAD family hydrolase